jgi:hypothetical protein
VECYDKRFVRAVSSARYEFSISQRSVAVSLATGLFDFAESFADVDRHEIRRYVSG